MCFSQYASLIKVFGIAFGAAMMISGDARAQAPVAPTELTATPSVPGDFAVTLFWVDNSTTEDSFEIQRCSGEGCADFVTIGFTPGNNINSYNDVGLSEKTSYTYRVRAVSSSGVSDFTNTASAATSYARPLQVSNLQGVLVGGAVQLTWTDEANNETSFEVERAEIGVSTAYEVIAVLPPDSASYSDTTMLNGAAYSYRVRPWRFDVEGGAPLTVEIEVGTPTAFAGTATARAKSRSSIEITWKGRFSRNTQIQVQRFDLNTSTWLTVGKVSANGEKKIVDSGLQSRTFYSYRLRSISPSAVSQWESLSATTR